MVKSSSSSKRWQCHLRSISLPSRLNPHPIKIETELNKLKTWETSLVSEVGLSADDVKTGLVGLEELYICLEELLNAPLTQQALVNYQNGNIIEEALDSSTGLLDLCQQARDSIVASKENVRFLRMVLRRSESETNDYISCNKKLKKEYEKSLKLLKKMENKIRSTVHFDVNHYLSMVIRVLREVALITTSILRLVFKFLALPILNRKQSRWSFISKVMLKSSSKMNSKVLNEVESVDLSLKNNAITDIDMSKKRLKALDDGLGGVEEGVDLLFRHLIKSRVSFLNILVR